MLSVQQALAMAVQHHQAGQLQQAEQLYRQILQVQPGHADVLQYMGMLAYQVGKPAIGVEYLTKAIAIHPIAPAYHGNLGVVYQSMGRYDEALASYAEAIRLKPDFAEAYYNRGLAYFTQGQAAEAVRNFEEAIRLNPNYAEARNNLGAALSQMGKYDEAVAACQQALRIQPNFPLAHNNLAGILIQQGKWDTAAEAARQALRLQPNLVEAHNNLAAALTPAGKLEEAVEVCRQALRIAPQSVEARNGLGIALRELGRLDESLAVSEEILRMQPDHVEAHVNRSLCRLLAGDLAQGWPEYEWRWKLKTVIPPSGNLPFWDGSDLAGRTILLRAEQGLGDTLQFIRYAPAVKERGGTVLVECPRALMKLLDGFPGIDRFVPKDDPLPACDVQAPLLTLPAIFVTTVATIPAQVPYVFAEDARVERWRERLGSGFRVGISWQGETRNTKDHQRSVRLKLFEPLASISGVRLVSLQKGPGTEQLRDAGFDVLDLGDDFDRDAPFLDTAAVMKCLDLVITVDTVIAHLAGALGVPVWVAVAAVPDWRWMLGRADTPWYPTMRLCRQKNLGNWITVFTEMTTALQRLLGTTPGRSSLGA